MILTVLRKLPALHASLQARITALLLHLLYDRWFKPRFTEVFVLCYADILGAAMRPPSPSSTATAKFLEHVYCQLLHSAEQVFAV
ncbi:MAG: hypothetical protein ACK4F6_19240, partial [Hylemonella sp.]